MAITAYPFDALDTSEVQYMELMDAIADSGIISGLAITAGAGMSVNVAVGAGFIKGFVFKSTAIENRTVTAAPATVGQTRKDYLILKLDLGANTITLEVKAGVATSGGGTLPALTQNTATWEHPIGILAIPNGAANVITAYITELLSTVARGIIQYRNTTERPTPSRVSFGFNTTSSLLEFYNGATWAALPIAWGNLTGVPATFPPIIGPGAAQAVAGNDPRLSDSRDPNAHDINGAGHTGTLALNKGGTGATTKANARINLGIWSQTAATADPTVGTALGDVLIEW